MGSSIAWCLEVRRTARSARVSRLSVSYNYGYANVLVCLKYNFPDTVNGKVILLK